MSSPVKNTFHSNPSRTVIEMPIAEIADRYTIAKLKLERLDDEQLGDPLAAQRQISWYYGGLKHLLEHPDREVSRIYQSLVEQLQVINGAMWDAEYDIRRGQDEQLGLEEIGRRALRIRDLNQERVRVKNRLCELSSTGFCDVKMNYASPASEAKTAS